MCFIQFRPELFSALWKPLGSKAARAAASAAPGQAYRDCGRPPHDPRAPCRGRPAGHRVRNTTNCRFGAATREAPIYYMEFCTGFYSIPKGILDPGV